VLFLRPGIVDFYLLPVAIEQKLLFPCIDDEIFAYIIFLN